MRHRQMVVPLLAICAAVSSRATADGWIDAARKLDLNTYALSANLYVSRSPYEGVDDFVVVFPMLAKFDPALVTDDTFFVRDGDLGLRTRLGENWDVAGVVSMQALGFGSGQSPALAGMSRRDWTVQGGASMGRNFGDYRIDIGAQTDLLAEHSGQEYELKFARVFDWDRHYLLPQLEVTYQSAKLVNHYFGVTAQEALPGRPEYRPGAAITYGTSLEWGWKWHRHWFMTATASIDWLPAEIRSSPIVDKDATWSFLMTIGYDIPTMMEMDSGRARATASGLEVSIGGFFVTADSKVFLTGGVPIDLESGLGVDHTEISVPASLRWRISPYHRLEFAYFELNRSGAGDIVAPVDVGDVTFQADETVNTSFDTRIFQFGYAYSLWHDRQKELSFYGGVHVSDVSFRGTGETDRVTADTTAILPVLGLELEINFTDRLSLGADLQLFVSDFNRYSGNLIDFGVSAKYTWQDRWTVGAGYRLYRQDIDTADESFAGDYRFEYRGPMVFLTARL